MMADPRTLDGDVTAHLCGAYSDGARLPAVRRFPVVTKPLDKAMLRQVQQRLDIRDAPSGLLDSASRLLSSLTHLAGVVMVPKLSTRSG